MVLRLRRFLTVATMLVVPACAADGAKAQGLDLMRATCADFLAMNGNDQSQLSLWLAGYFAGGAQRPLLDLEKITAAPAELTTICSKNPQLPLVGAESRAVFISTPAP